MASTGYDLGTMPFMTLLSSLSIDSSAAEFITGIYIAPLQGEILTNYASHNIMRKRWGTTESWKGKQQQYPINLLKPVYVSASNIS